MNKEQFLKSGLIEQFVLGITSPEEAAEVERYAATFPEIQEEIIQLREAVEDYAKQYAIEPPTGTKDAILDEIDTIQSSTYTDPSSSSWLGWLPMAAIIASVILAFNFYQKKNQAEKLLFEAENQLVAFQKECKEEKARLQSTQNRYAFLTNKATQAVNIRGTGLSPDANVVVYYNSEEESALLNVIHLPVPPPGKTYQMWADVEGVMINMGVFKVNDPLLREMLFIKHAESLNITLEPDGGSDHPTVSLLQANGKVQA